MQPNALELCSSHPAGLLHFPSDPVPWPRHLWASLLLRERSFIWEFSRHVRNDKASEERWKCKCKPLSSYIKNNWTLFKDMLERLRSMHLYAQYLLCGLSISVSGKSWHARVLFIEVFLLLINRHRINILPPRSLWIVSPKTEVSLVPPRNYV